MARTLGARLTFAAAATLIALVGSATRSVVAAPPTEPPVTMVFPAGVACAGFDLAIQISENSNRVFKEFKDKNGTVVRILSAGKGSTLVFTNQLTNLSLFLKPNGSVEHRTLNPD